MVGTVLPVYQRQYYDIACDVTHKFQLLLEVQSHLARQKKRMVCVTLSCSGPLQTRA